MWALIFFSALRYLTDVGLLFVGAGEKVIRDHSRGHEFLDDPSQNRGAHFNDADGNHYDY